VAATSLDLFPTLSHWRDNAELLHHAQRIPVGPGFHDLSAGDVEYVDPRHHDRLAGGGNAHQLALVRAASCPADHHPDPFGKLVFDSEVNVGKGTAVEGDELFEALGTRRQFDAEAVGDVAGVENLICYDQISLVPDFLNATAIVVYYCSPVPQPIQSLSELVLKAPQEYDILVADDKSLSSM
jgi:hypothetical protein